MDVDMPETSIDHEETVENDELAAADDESPVPNEEPADDEEQVVCEIPVNIEPLADDDYNEKGTDNEEPADDIVMTEKEKESPVPEENEKKSEKPEQKSILSPAKLDFKPLGSLLLEAVMEPKSPNKFEDHLTESM